MPRTGKHTHTRALCIVHRRVQQTGVFIDYIRGMKKEKKVFGSFYFSPPQENNTAGAQMLFAQFVIQGRNRETSMRFMFTRLKVFYPYNR